MRYRSSRKRRKERAESIFKEIVLKTSLMWGKKEIPRSRKPKNFQRRLIQRDLHIDTL